MQYTGCCEHQDKLCLEDSAIAPTCLEITSFCGVVLLAANAHYGRQTEKRKLLQQQQ